MGVVYHAIDPNIGRPVAIKTIQLGNRKPEEQERLRERLFREARSAGILSHPGMVTIYDVEHQGDVAYIAMEYVDGPTLDQLLSEEAITPERMFSILGQAAAALDYAHQKGIVHRDIKPANIMIARDGTVKITDFGIAKFTASEQFTMTGAIVGTPHYMSPEQVQGLGVDGHSDQFSLAVIAYEMLTGEKPYTGDHLTTVVYKIVAEEPSPVTRLNPSLGGAIETVMRKAMGKKPESRYRNCTEFIDALEKACAATKGWKTLPRGGDLNEPTVAEVGKPRVVLPPARRRSSTSTGTMERVGQRKSGFLTFLLAMMVAAGLLALIGWQAGPWLLKKGGPGSENDAAKTADKPAAPAAPASPVSPPAASPETQRSAQTAQPASPTASQPANPSTPTADAKPSPMPPNEHPAATPEPSTKPDLDVTPKRSTPVHAAAPQPQSVMMISSPGGARATLDGRPETACTTPCEIDAMPGRHTVEFNLKGYQIEHREAFVGSSPMEMPAVVLRPLGGTLWLTSIPAGAAVLVDGKRISQTTPAQIPLPPGTYTITVEKDGKQATGTVEVHSGISYLKLQF